MKGNALDFGCRTNLFWIKIGILTDAKGLLKKHYCLSDRQEASCNAPGICKNDDPKKDLRLSFLWFISLDKQRNEQVNNER
jgi:hypothetical protein